MSEGMSEAAHDDLKPGDPSRIGPYQLVRRLGGGGMGTVFLGRSASGRLFAVKVIHPHLVAEPGFRARFRSEVGAVRRVSGAFTAGVVDADADGPVPWLAMEYVSGESLEKAVALQGPFPPARLRVLAAQLAEGLCAIHAAGLVHRDLKPGNVLLAADGPRIIDFGVSRTLGVDGGTRTWDVVGTPGFLSPEQAEGGEASAASDVFSLGAVLAFAGTGRRPFGLGDLTSRVYRVLHAAPDLDGIPDGEVRELIERCLAKDPAARPAPADILAGLGGSAAVDAGEGSLLPAVVQPAPIEQVPVAEVAADQPAGTDTYLGDEGIRPVPAPPGIPAIVTVNVSASGNARVIVAGGDVHVDG